MKKLTLILVIFISIFGYSQSTDSIYALKEAVGSPSSLNKVDPTSVNSTFISTSPPPFNSPFIKSSSLTIIDPHRNKYCFVLSSTYLDSLQSNGAPPFNIVNNFPLSNQKNILITVDLTTGIWEGVVLEHSSFLQYNCSDSTYYALGNNTNGLIQPSLVKIDPLTGYSQTISTDPLPVIVMTFQGDPSQQPAIDPINKRFIFHGVPYPKPGTGILHIYSIDLVSGAIVSDYIVNDIDAIHQMVFNCRDSAFYAIKVNYTPNERYLVKIDPITFATNQISALPYNIWYHNYHPTVITVSNNKYVFLGADSTMTNFKIYSFDIDDGTLTHSTPVNYGDVGSLASYPVCKVEPSISNNNCNGTSVDFTSPFGGIGYEWDFGDPLSGIENSSNLQNPEHEFTTPGTYQIRLVLNSCYTNDTVYKTIEVDFIISPTLELGLDQLLCPNESLQLSVSNDFNSVLWNTGALTSELTITTGGIYSVVATDSLGCMFSDTIQVDYSPDKTFDLGLDQLLCPNEIFQLSIPNDFKTVLWNTGSQTSELTITTGGIYFVTATDSLDCMFSDTIQVDYNPDKTFDLGLDQLLCPNKSLQLSVPNDFNSVLWNTGAQTSELIVTTGGIYFVTVTDNIGCLFSDTVKIDYKPEVTLTLNYTDDSLTAIPYSSINSWTLNGVNIDSRGMNSIFINQPGTYQLIRNVNGCVYTDEVDLNTTLCDINISPNPSEGIVTLNTHLGHIQKIDIISMDGKIVKQYLDIETSIFTFDISELSAGNFLFRVRTDNCESVLKVVKE